ncbi:MAG TPA: hypothetical protein VJ916_01420 [Anaerovoracaceae bacterium]|nr:hypothetical protein [Anaerovoracaceae bacterium]
MLNKLFVVFLVLFSVFFIVSCDDQHFYVRSDIEDFREYQLKGKVKEVTINEYKPIKIRGKIMPGERGKYVEIEELKFNEKGYLLSKKIKTRNGELKWKYLFTYENGKNLISRWYCDIDHKNSYKSIVHGVWANSLESNLEDFFGKTNDKTLEYVDGKGMIPGSVLKNILDTYLSHDSFKNKEESKLPTFDDFIELLKKSMTDKAFYNQFVLNFPEIENPMKGLDGFRRIIEDYFAHQGYNNFDIELYCRNNKHLYEVLSDKVTFNKFFNKYYVSNGYYSEDDFDQFQYLQYHLDNKFLIQDYISAITYDKDSKTRIRNDHFMFKDDQDSSVVMVYNDEGYLVEEIYSNSRISYEYSDTKIKYSRYSNGDLSFVEESTLDEKGRTSLNKIFSVPIFKRGKPNPIDENVFVAVSYEYNNKDLATESLLYEVNQNSGLGGENGRVTRYEYEYDSSGNWIKKISFSNGKATRYIERLITYY